MAYGRNFGFRSFQNLIRDGRLSAPATGTALKIGTAVKADSANPGRLVAVTSEEAPTALSGIVLYEHIVYNSVDQDPALHTPSDYDFVPVGARAQRIHGVGSKVWFKNTLAKPLYDGREIAAQTMVQLDGATPEVQVGDALTPADGTNGWWQKAASAANAWLLVQSVDYETGLVEARFTF